MADYQVPFVCEIGVRPFAKPDGNQAYARPPCIPISREVTMRTVLENPQQNDQRAIFSSYQGLREGDWEGYRHALAQCRSAGDTWEETADALDRKRQFALAYLGRRAMLYGGACSRTAPRILTQQFVMDLEKNNRGKRYTRYPWLETLMKLLAEIEALQEQHASNNVISLVKTGERQTTTKQN